MSSGRVLPISNYYLMVNLGTFINDSSFSGHMLEIKIVSGPKGGNPGGKCVLPSPRQNQLAYLKYCEGSSLPKDLPFTPNNQPIYEAITFKMLQDLGLHVPRFYVVDNREQVVEFRYADDVKKRLNPNMPCYFVSNYIHHNMSPLPDEADVRMAREKVYLDFVCVGDIEGIRQNYEFIPEPHPGYVVYLDLGCNFVDAKDNKISQRSCVRKLVSSGKGPRSNLKKSLKHAQRFLEKHYILTNHDLPHEQDYENLWHLVESIPEMILPSIPKRQLRVSSFLSEDELTEIKNLLTMSIYQTTREYIKKHNANGRIKKEN